jgi:hypothetical protein
MHTASPVAVGCTLVNGVDGDVLLIISMLNNQAVGDLRFNFTHIQRTVTIHLILTRDQLHDLGNRLCCQCGVEVGAGLKISVAWLLRYT